MTTPPGPRTAFETRGLPPQERARAWEAAIAASYFPLDLTFRTAERFTGRIARWTLGQAAVSRLRSDALSYRRRSRHLREAEGEAFLITIPRTTRVRFAQMGREVTCEPGGFVIERGNEPYTFAYDAPSDLVAVKVSRDALAAHLPRPGRYCALGFDARDGVGALMVDLVRATERRWPALSPAAREALGRQFLELLALAVEGDPRAAESAGEAVRAAHLRRVGNVIARRFCELDLSPGEIARACGISKRHLHGLCAADGASVCERVREARLAAARSQLSRPGDAQAITEIAFACGFSDSSQFARAYRARFGEAPRETRGAARRGRAA